MENKTGYLTPDVVLRMIFEDDLSLILDTEYKLVTSAFSIWEALSCLSADEIQDHAFTIADLLKNIPLTDFKELTNEFMVQGLDRINKLRRIALEGRE